MRPAAAVDPADVEVVPADQAPWDDLRTVLGSSQPGSCSCQRYRIVGWFWDLSDEERARRLHEQTYPDDPTAPTTGLVGYLDDEPVGWVAVAPRERYARLITMRSTWKGRDEATADRDEPGVWAITCVTVRVGFRRRGLTYALIGAAAAYARERGATAIEGYAMRTEPGRQITWGELHVGAEQAYAEAGFVEIASPSKRRVTMRLELT